MLFDAIINGMFYHLYSLLLAYRRIIYLNVLILQVHLSVMVVLYIILLISTYTGMSLTNVDSLSLLSQFECVFLLAVILYWIGLPGSIDGSDESKHPYIVPYGSEGRINAVTTKHDANLRFPHKCLASDREGSLLSIPSFLGFFFKSWRNMKFCQMLWRFPCSFSISLFWWMTLTLIYLTNLEILGETPLDHDVSSFLYIEKLGLLIFP